MDEKGFDRYVVTIGTLKLMTVQGLAHLNQVDANCLTRVIRHNKQQPLPYYQQTAKTLIHIERGHAVLATEIIGNARLQGLDFPSGVGSQKRKADGEATTYLYKQLLARRNEIWRPELKQGIVKTKVTERNGEKRTTYTWPSQPWPEEQTLFNARGELANKLADAKQALIAAMATLDEVEEFIRSGQTF